MVYHYNRTASTLGWQGKTYAPGVAIPKALATAMGWVDSTPETPEAPAPETPETPETPAPDVPDALVLINSALDSAPLTNLPTIGQSGARAIFESRPEDGGYESLEHVQELLPQLFVPPYKTDWSQVKAWVNDVE